MIISPFADVVNAWAAERHRAATPLRVWAARRRRGGPVASVILQRMPPAAPPLQATPLVRAAHAGPSSVFSSVGRQLDVVISVLVAKSHLDKGQIEQPALGCLVSSRHPADQTRLSHLVDVKLLHKVQVSAFPAQMSLSQNFNPLLFQAVHHVVVGVLI